MVDIGYLKHPDDVATLVEGEQRAGEGKDQHAAGMTVVGTGSGQKRVIEGIQMSRLNSEISHAPIN